MHKNVLIMYYLNKERSRWLLLRKLIKVGLLMKKRATTLEIMKMRPAPKYLEINMAGYN